jgi:hypothetical protein
MTAISETTKIKKLGQSKSDASGWNRHVNKYQKRVANKIVRRIARREIEGAP